jgi:hypothetical protein
VRLIIGLVTFIVTEAMRICLNGTSAYTWELTIENPRFWDFPPARIPGHNSPSQNMGILLLNNLPTSGCSTRLPQLNDTFKVFANMRSWSGALPPITNPKWHWCFTLLPASQPNMNSLREDPRLCLFTACFTLLQASQPDMNSLRVDPRLCLFTACFTLLPASQPDMNSLREDPRLIRCQNMYFILLLMEQRYNRQWHAGQMVGLTAAFADTSSIQLPKVWPIAT